MLNHILKTFYIYIYIYYFLDLNFSIFNFVPAGEKK